MERDELKIDPGDRQHILLPSLFDFTHTSGFPNEAHDTVPCFLYFCDFQKQICGALPDLG
ncbi:hypothetical protein I79_021565 [Cricetulus griseus]|uniref:Uncharacterized protein n=1 Tax=Cricetulus griseus TaxID=10029 RepID=G3ID04_CRIGR|nr:hypothetical protein I79_021565 [Cricetulus griseus]